MSELEFVPPMECREIHALPEGANWQLELKLDGYRAIAGKRKGEVKLFSRRGLDFSKRFSQIATSLARLTAKSFVVDGEIVAVDENGRHSFGLLQNGSSSSIQYFIFDVLAYGNKPLADRPLKERRDLLEREFDDLPAGLNLAPVLQGSSELILEKVREFEFEGVVAKRKDSVYVSGERPGTWLKKKTQRTDDFVIGGFIGGGSVDELIVGVPGEGGGLRFVSALQGGLMPMLRRDLHRTLRPLVTGSCPFTNLPEKKGRSRMDREKMSRVHWIRPEVTCELAFQEWTADGRLRHARFLRIRDDQ